MAIDPSHFSLYEAMQSVWNDQKVLSPTHRELIGACLPSSSEEGPKSEEDLQLLQEVTAACILLNGIRTDKYHWLSPHGISFPDSVLGFTYLVADRICRFEFTAQKSSVSWSQFREKLRGFLIRERPHVVTLNYDDLVGEIISSEPLLSDLYKSGFVNGRFARKNLIRSSDEKECSWFLKLHGSPYIYTAKDNSIRVSSRTHEEDINTSTMHLVLSHVSKKEILIDASPLLREYWDFFTIALRDSEEILIIGYSGNDTHLNHLLRNNPNLKVRLVEWVGAGGQAVRRKFWEDTVGRGFDYVPMEDILDFDFFAS